MADDAVPPPTDMPGEDYAGQEDFHDNYDYQSHDSSQEKTSNVEVNSAALVVTLIVGMVLLAAALIWVYFDTKKQKKRTAGHALGSRLEIRAAAQAGAQNYARKNDYASTMIGRVKETQQIYEALARTGARIVITAPDGMGKTMLMKSIISNPQEMVQALEKYTKPGVPISRISIYTWIPGESERTIKSELINFAINLFLPSAEQRLKDIRSAIQSAMGADRDRLMKEERIFEHELMDLRRILNAGATDELLARLNKEFSRRDDWLLLVDNIDDPTLLSNFLPTSRGRIIYTTSKKISELPSSFTYTRYVDLGSLPQNDALALLEAMVLNSPTNLLDDPEKIIPKVLETNFGFVPLQVMTFGRYACGSQRKVIDLIEDLTSFSPSGDLFTFNDLLQYMYENSLTYKDPNTANARKLLEICAYMSPNGIPSSLFLQDDETLNKMEETFKDNPVDIFEGYEFYSRIDVFSEKTFDTSKNILESFGLISFAKDQIYMHPVLQEKIRAMVEVYEESSFTLAQLLHILRLNFVRPLQTGEQRWPELVALHPTILELLKTVKNFDSVPFLNALGLFHMNRASDRKLSEGYFKEALALWETLSSVDSIEVAKLCNGLANVYCYSKEYAKAIEANKRALNVWESQAGKSNPNTTTTKSNLAWVYGLSGDSAKAISTYEDILKVLESVHGKKSSKLIEVLTSIAYQKELLKQKEDVVTYLQRALDIAESEQGEGSLPTASLLVKLAEAKANCMQLQEAETLAKKAVAIYQANRHDGLEKEYKLAVELAVNIQKKTKAILSTLEDPAPSKAPATATSKTEVKKALKGK